MLIIEDNVPRWAAAESRRAYAYNVLNEWEVTVKWVAALSLPRDRKADTYFWPEHHQAHIYLGDTLRANAQGRTHIQHEFRHLHYVPLYVAGMQTIEARFNQRLGRKQALALYDELFLHAVHQRIALDLEARGFPRFD